MPALTASNASIIYTIGYEGIDAERVIQLLRENGVQRLIDARYRPGSRKAGLSKTPLSTALAEVGISYTHDRALGTPPEIMRRLREEGTYDWDAYRDFLLDQTEALDRAADLAREESVCLLCYEANALECHRRVVADELADRAGMTVEHIPVVAA
jgi:uncharacterized protein (DUF488 family)